MFALLLLILFSIIAIIIQNNIFIGILGLISSILLAIFDHKLLSIRLRFLYNRIFNKNTNFITISLIYDIEEDIKLVDLFKNLQNKYNDLNIINNEVSFIYCQFKTENFNYHCKIKKDFETVDFTIEDLKINNREYSLFEEDLQELDDNIHSLLRSKSQIFISVEYKDLNPLFEMMLDKVKITEIKSSHIDFAVKINSSIVDIILTKTGLQASLSNFTELRKFYSISQGFSKYIFKNILYFK